jgi:hypothetical protein
MVTPEAERAIHSGLAYLKSQQGRDGSFGTGKYRGNVAVSSLAGLAMMAGGHQPGRGAYGKVVADALRYVLGQEDAGEPGYFRTPRLAPQGPVFERGYGMYDHGFATLFLAESCGMVSDRRLRDDVHAALRRAVKLTLASQRKNNENAWRYTPSSRDADISVTICQIMALRAARNAGVDVPKKQVDDCVEYVKRCQDRAGGWFRYMAQGGGGGQAFARTAAGVVALYSAGIYTGDEVEAGLKYLLKYHKPNGPFARPDPHYFYGHYYAVQAMWLAGGGYWSEWFPAIRDELVGHRSRTSDGAWHDHICAHYATAMACIILQVPNNYLPILQK